MSGVINYPSTAGAGEVAPKGSEGVGEALTCKESLGSADALHPLRPAGHLPRCRGGGQIHSFNTPSPFILPKTPYLPNPYKKLKR
jgi:hypothetical protein